ncbi:ATP-binding protein [Spirillospora sp. CA-253888]
MRSDTASDDVRFRHGNGTTASSDRGRWLLQTPVTPAPANETTQASEVAMRPGRHLISTVCTFLPAGTGTEVAAGRRPAVDGDTVPPGHHVAGDRTAHRPVPSSAGRVTVSIAASAGQRAVLEAAAALDGVDVTTYAQAAVLKRLRLDRADRGLPRCPDREGGRVLTQLTAPCAQSAQAAHRVDEHVMLSCRWTLAQQPPTVPAQARALARAVLRSRGPDGQDDVCVLLISELVTNAVRYGGPGPVTLQLLFTGSEVVCGVGDRSREPPRREQVGPEDEGGRGLHLLASLSSCWNWYPTGTGKTVWFTRPLNGARQAVPVGAPRAPTGGVAHPLLDPAWPDDG